MTDSSWGYYLLLGIWLSFWGILALACGSLAFEYVAARTSLYLAVVPAIAAGVASAYAATWLFGTMLVNALEGLQRQFPKTDD